MARVHGIARYRRQVQCERAIVDRVVCCANATLSRVAAGRVKWQGYVGSKAKSVGRYFDQ